MNHAGLASGSDGGIGSEPECRTLGSQTGSGHLIGRHIAVEQITHGVVEMALTASRGGEEHSSLALWRDGYGGEATYKPREEKIAVVVSWWVEENVPVEAMRTSNYSRDRHISTIFPWLV
ncbi:hypothetical protein BD309DRAFT_993232 [Dichomitus squalens]|nr:hypothetical protein BD309DRAFT_993232 [Dichomitus squalens]